MLNRCLMILGLFLLSSTHALANTQATTPPSPPIPQSLTELSVEDLLTALKNQDSAERTNAQSYILGIIDATESRTWCGYGPILPHEIISHISGELQQIENSKRKERASSAIQHRLNNLLPCKKGKK